MSETVPQAALDMIGKELVPTLAFEVERGTIRRMAEAIGDYFAQKACDFIA